MKCTSCGAESPPEARACPYCGCEHVGAVEPENKPPREPSPPWTPPPESNKRAKEQRARRRVYIAEASPHNREICLLLCLFLGVLGIHRFYVGKTATGVLWFFTGGFLVVGAISDFFKIFSGNFRDKRGLYLK